MNKAYAAVLFLTMFLLIQSGCTMDFETLGNNGDVQTQIQQQVIIYNLTDLEVIKRTADYLKAKGETVSFTESEITILNGEEAVELIEGFANTDICTESDYMEVKLHRSIDPLNPDHNDCYIVYLDKNGVVIGYKK